MKKESRLFIGLVLMFAIAGVAVAQTTLFQDDFDSPPLDVTTKWKRGSNSSNVTIQNNSLHVVSESSSVTGWIVTQQAYNANNISVSLKIVKPGIECDLGISPTSPLASAPNGIYDQPNFYRFYIVGVNNQPPYALHPYIKQDGGAQTPLTPEPLVLPSPYGDGTTPFYIRIRLGDGMIYFEYSKDGCYWSAVYREFFALPGYLTSSPFYYEIAASNKLVNGNPDIPDVVDFKIESHPDTGYPVSTILNDPLNNPSFSSSPTPGVSRKVYGGSFSGAGWKPNSSEPDGNEVTDMVVYDLGRYIENGSLEIDVTQFDPNTQNNTNPNLKVYRHHVLAMFRQPWGGHHAVENVDAFWDLHTGTQYSGGVKFLSNTYYSCDEYDTRNTGDELSWNKTSIYHLKIVWDNRTLKYFRDNVCHAWHVLKNPMQLRYIYLGRDSTVSGEYVTGFLHNQYPTMSDANGPLYSNLVVKEFRSSETVPPDINSPAIVDLYQNAARLSWSTTEPAVCYVEYGTTMAYTKKTTVFGPPATSFTTLLAGLNSNTLYHYRITAEDDAGNVTQSADLTFPTVSNGVYVFKPVADTYIEADDRANRNSPNPDYPWLYGPTRRDGNYGWMNLMTALYRDSFLQFNVAGVGNITQAKLRLYGRQTSVTGANVRQFTPGQNNWEKNATWTDANNNHQYLNRSVYSSAPLLGSIPSTTTGQWQIIDVSAATRDANDNYYFVLQGTGTPIEQNGILAKVSCGSFDSRESTNNQPELIVTTAQAAFTEVATALPGVEDGDAAWGDYDRDGDLDIAITGMGANGALAKIFRNDNNGILSILTRRH